MEQLGVKYTTARKKESLLDIHQSALTDNVMSKNYTIDLDGVSPHQKNRLEEERCEREAIFIRKARIHDMNQDGGCNHLPEVVSKLYAARPGLVVYS